MRFDFFSNGGLKARALRGALLTGLSFGGQSMLRLAGNLALTRILFPEAFGIMALVQVVITGLTMFSDIGLRASIIQDKRGEDPSFLNTAFVLQLGRGVFLWLVTCLIAEPVSGFYETPLLAQILPIAGLVAIFQGFNSTKLYTQNRALTLGRVTIIQLGAQAVGLVVMVGLALWLQSIWALVLGSLIPPILVALGSHLYLPGVRNKLLFEKAAARQLVRFGKYIFLATLTGFMVQHADRAILGKTVSLTELALYSIAFFFASVPLMLVRRIADTVVFPLYSQVPPSESSENRAKIAKVRWILTAPALLMLGLLACIGNDLVILLYDPRYEAAGVILVLIAIAQMPALITTSYSALPLAAGHSGWYAVLTSSSAVLRVLALLIGATQFGLVGVVLAPPIAVMCFYPILMYVSHQYKGCNFKHDILALAAAIIIATFAIWLNPEIWTLFKDL